MIDSDRVPSALGHKTDTISQSSRATLEPFMNEQYYGHGKCMCGWTDKNVALVSRPQAGLTKKGRKWWEYHTQAVLTKVGSDGVPHTGSADKERQELIRPSLRGRPVDRISFCSNQGCVDRSRLQTHRRIRLVQNSDVFIPKSSSETQSVESHQSHPRVCWFKSSSDTVSGMWTVETRCILIQVVFWHSQWNLISSKQEHARCQVISDTATGAQTSNQVQAGQCGTTPFTSHTQAVNYTVWKQERKKKHAFHGFALTCLWRLKCYRSIPEPNWMTQIDRCAAELTEYY